MPVCRNWMVTRRSIRRRRKNSPRTAGCSSKPVPISSAAAAALTPDHIRALHEAVCRLTPKAPHASHHRVLASERQVVEIKLDGSFQVIGERINPTGKKKLQAELRAGKLDMVRAMAREQERNGASILDVNMGTNGIDEKEMMLKAIYEVTGVSGLPLSIDTSSPDIMEAALRIYPGRALVNSISCETEKRKKLLPVVKSTAPCSSPCLFRITVSPRPSKKNMPSSTSSWPMPMTTAFRRKMSSSTPW